METNGEVRVLVITSMLLCIPQKNADNESLKMLGHTAGQAASEERVPGLVSIIFTRIDTIVKKNDYELMSLCVHFFEV